MRVIASALIAAALVAESSANATPADNAKAALERFIGAWNTSDVEAVRGEMNFPNLSLFGNLTVAQTPAEFEVDFARMRAEEDWARSGFGEMQVVRESAAQVHILTTYTRFNSAGAAYQSGLAFYVVTNQDGHWGMQFRSPVRDAAVNESTREELQATLEQFFEAWNREDNPGIHKVIHFPHAFLIGGGRVNFSPGPEELMTDFAGMREREGWDRSSYDSLEVAYADELLAFVYLTFHRLNAEGKAYQDTPALWIMTRDGVGWGIQVRVIL